jgi:DNA-binding NarL/FixJ family response regulator
MKRIAVVEDHGILRTSFVNLINDEDNFTVIVEAENGQQLLTRINPLALPDVVLVDVEMPIMDGPETVLELRKRYGNKMKILALSIHKEVRLINEMLQNGANGYVSKAASANELFTGIKKVISVGYYLSKDISIIMKDSGLVILQNPKLSEKEEAILKLIYEEKGNPEIAEILGIPRSTVNTYRTRMIEKVGATNTVGLVLYALREGICKLEE